MDDAAPDAKAELDQLLTEAEVEPSLTKDQLIDILKERLVRRSAIIDTIRHAYYHDVIVIKENLQAKELNPAANLDERVHALPSVDLRDTLPLFAPAQTYLRVHPCESCGGTLELVHGETHELNEARSQCAKALKAEQNMKGIVHRLRDELKEATEISEALQQRLRALTKENAFTLEQLQISRKTERDQKALLAEVKSKLHTATANNESVSRLAQQLKELTAEHNEVAKQKSLLTNKCDDLQDELQALLQAHATQKADYVRSQLECESTKRQLEDMTDLKTHFSTELNNLAAKHKEHVHVNEIVQASLVKCKQDYATLSTKFEQTKRQLEDQLAGEEISRENIHERYMDEKKRCKQLQVEAERARRDAAEFQELFAQVTSQADSVERAHQAQLNDEHQVWLQQLLQAKQEIDQAGMRENDLASEVMKRFFDDDDDEAMFIPSYYGDDSDDEGSTRPTLLLPSRPMSQFSDGSLHSDSSRQHTPATTGRLDTPDRQPAGVGDAALETKKKRTLLTTRKGAGNAELVQLMSEMKDMQDKCKLLRHKVHESEKHIAQLKAQITDLTITNQALDATIKDYVAEDSERNQSETELLRTLKTSRETIEALKAQADRFERKVVSFEGFFDQIGGEIFSFYQNAQIVAPIDPMPVIMSEDETPSKATLSPDILAKKAIMKRELYEEKVLNNYVYAYSERVELFLVDMKRAYDFMIEVKHESMEYMKTCQAGPAALAQTTEIEKLNETVDRLKMALDTERTSTAKLERMTRITLNDLTQLQEKMRNYERESGDIEIERNRLLEEKRKIAFIMMEKSKTLDREIDLNEQMAQKIQAKEQDIAKHQEINAGLSATIKAFEDAIQFKKDTNCDVGILVVPQLFDTGMQTDPWKPQGLVLRQRNSPNQVPQRYEGPAKIMVACPSLDVLLKGKPLYPEPSERPSTSSMAQLPPPNPLENNPRRVQTADPQSGGSLRKPSRKIQVGRINNFFVN
ncbi:hypothetical protein ACHHYP_10243 [Achlya hypogyna]|uniref:Uncharacterized protein n=1 Tax=Achlya hypogyna TaxID=1202772 RepID=A0A1V9YLT8_ACHHY|nr:hypothetical protein ACHHYP_10243 [Achlya hypogyna]